MKKNISIAIILIITLVLTSCSKSEVETINISDSKQVKIYNYQEAESIAERVKMIDFKITTQNDGNIGTFCIYNDTMYYALDYLDYFDNPTGKKSDIAFEKQYNTQIRSYSIESGKDTLLYQYDEEGGIEVSDLQCNGKELAWEDYTKDKIWNVKKMTINSDTAPEDIFSYKTKESKIDSSTLTITEDSLFWYDQEDEGDYPIIVCRYDFESKRVTTEKKRLVVKLTI